MCDYPYHEAANCFELMNESDFHDLVESIRKNGLRHPITLHEGAILDGRNRYLACKKLGIEPTFVEFDGPGLAVDFVRDCNIIRRPLTTGQRAMAEAKLSACRKKELQKLEAQGVKEVRPRGLNGKAPRPLNGDTHIPKRTLNRAERVLKECPAEVVEAVSAGTTTLYEAERAIKPKRLKNGRQVKNSSYKREVLKVFGQLVRATDKLNIHDACRDALAVILAEIQGA